MISLIIEKIYKDRIEMKQGDLLAKALVWEEEIRKMLCGG